MSKRNLFLYLIIFDKMANVSFWVDAENNTPRTTQKKGTELARNNRPNLGYDAFL